MIGIISLEATQVLMLFSLSASQCGKMGRVAVKKKQDGGGSECQADWVMSQVETCHVLPVWGKHL